ncbi:L,D-transpeptidase [Bifidobacterium sp. ESL0798]|uniref:L,D-transpeptidase n=1 Tax=unclassified Bifidobacterium TaxID=2608897 RepID=UPI0023F6DF0F|nr:MULTISPECIES: L,D-transpeptidase [unclassified Bifidobacterium]WEV52715.1 L,D-transpeptidase [Bifidobacterium sp. ESL0704]WEV74304.1 L,D-transpeptidase [Bifidobacterium sp. ESL0798]
MNNVNNYGNEPEALTSEMSQADIAALGIEARVQPKKQGKHRLAIIIAAVVLAVLVIAVVASFFGARWYYKDKAAPGVRLGNVAVAGQNAAQLEKTVDQQVNNSKVIIADGQGKKASASFKDLGVKVDTDRTVQDLLAAKGEGAGRVVPFQKADVKLAANVTDLPIDTYLTNTFVKDHDKAVPSSVVFDANSNAFVANAGHGGRSPEMSGVKNSVNTLIADPGQTESVKISYKTIDTPITQATAQSAAESANKILANKIVIGNGDAGKFEVPVSQLAAWIKPDADLEKGSIKLDIDKNAIVNYMNTEMPKQLNQDMVSQQDIVDGSGNVLVTMSKGVDGVKVKDGGAVADQVYNAMTSGQPATIQAAADITKFDVKQTKSEMRIVVDRSTQTATIYKDDQQVQSFPVCTGKPGHETSLGNYVINVRYTVQTMRGPGYVTPNVQWVSYFNGGQGFHGAPWNPTGIGTGDPAGHGSHGCVNMNISDAKWIFDNCPQGTLVQVVGAQPGGPVR